MCDDVKKKDSKFAFSDVSGRRVERTGNAGCIWDGLTASYSGDELVGAASGDTCSSGEGGCTAPSEEGCALPIRVLRFIKIAVLGDR